MSAVRIVQLPLSRPVSSIMNERLYERAVAIRVPLQRRIAGHRRYDEQKNH